MAPSLADADLTAAQAGDLAALDRLITAHRQGVYRYGLHVCRTTEDAEDAVQETLWAATRALRTFRGTASSIASWLFTIVRRECLRLLEGHRKAPGVTDVIPTLRALYYEVASTTAGYALRSLQELADPMHILWGSDLPFVYGDRLQEEVDHWEAYTGFSTDQRMVVEQQNALRLFPRFASGK